MPKDGIPAPHIIAARRLPLCVAAVDPASDTVSAASLPATARHSRRLDIERNKPKRQRFKRYLIGLFHMDIAEVQTAEGKFYLFVGLSSSRSNAPCLRRRRRSNRCCAQDRARHEGNLARSVSISR
jgi:hypothetical protein